MDTITKLEESIAFVERHKWNAIHLDFKTPIVVSVESIQKMMTMMRMSEVEVKRLVGQKYGVNNM